MCFGFKLRLTQINCIVGSATTFEIFVEVKIMNAMINSFNRLKERSYLVHMSTGLLS